MKCSARGRLLGFAVVLLLAFIQVPTAFAQATAQISGTVRNTSGGVLPGVDVAVTQTNTGLTRHTVTDQSGSYVLPNLPIGPYQLDVSLCSARWLWALGVRL